jgi:hypothetical protein
MASPSCVRGAWPPVVLVSIAARASQSRRLRDLVDVSAV